MPVESPVRERRKISSQEPKTTMAPEVPKNATIAQRMDVFKLQFDEMASMTTGVRENNPGTTSAMCSTC